MKLIHRKYQSEDDYWRSAFLARGVPAARPPRGGLAGLSLGLLALARQREHLSLRSERGRFPWETGDGRLAAVLHPDGPGEAFLQVHPAWRSAELEVAMMSVAETQFAVTQADGCQRLVIWAHEGDALGQDLLQRRGYSRATS